MGLVWIQNSAFVFNHARDTIYFHKVGLTQFYLFSHISLLTGHKHGDKGMRRGVILPWTDYNEGPLYSPTMYNKSLCAINHCWIIENL